MRIIAGKARGRKLLLPENEATRPLLEKAKGALFNMLGSRVIHAEILDLYAGSGAIGLEAISRGANAATFIEMASSAVTALSRNIEFCHCEKTCRLIAKPVITGLNECKGSFHLIFLDPPFAIARHWQESEEGSAVMVMTRERLLPAGMIVFRLEEDVRNYPQEWKGVPLVKDRVYGRSRILLYSQA